jgi:transposase
LEKCHYRFYPQMHSTAADIGKFEFHFPTYLMARQEKRDRLLYLYNRGFTSARELSEISEVPLRTVYDILHRIQVGHTMQHRAGAGRPQLLSTVDKQRITRLALSHPLSSANEILDSAVKRGTPSVSVRTIQRQLKASQVIKLTPKHTLPLTLAQRQQRVAFCQQHLDDDWSRTVFTDESSFMFHRDRAPRWSSGGKPAKVPHSKFPKTVMIWGGISVMGKTTLAIVRGSVNQHRYQDILHEHLLPNATAYYGDFWRLQQDNARPHTAISTMNWLEENVPAVISWPANSADLSPIENLWGLMKHRVEKASAKNWEDFVMDIQDVWDSFDSALLSRFIDSMPQRLRACIAAEGGQIDLNLL